MEVETTRNEVREAGLQRLGARGQHDALMEIAAAKVPRRGLERGPSLGAAIGFRQQTMDAVQMLLGKVRNAWALPALP